MPAGRRALVTGGSGFVGRRLVRKLSSEGWDVRVLSSGSAPRDAAVEQSAAVRWFGLGSEDIRAASQGVTHFFNFAVVYDRPEHPQSLLDEVNVRLPLRIMAALHSACAGFTCVLGDSFFRKFPPDATRQGRYTASKQQLADELRGMAARDCRIALLQIEQVYGPGESVSKVFPRVAQQMLAHTPRIALTSGEQRRDFIHVDDVVAAACVTADGEWNGLVNVECGSGQSTEVREVFRRMHDLAHSRSVLGFGDIAPDQKIVDSTADQRWLSERGWSCHYSLEDGLQDFMRDMAARFQTPTVAPGEAS